MKDLIIIVCGMLVILFLSFIIVYFLRRRGIKRKLLSEGKVIDTQLGKIEYQIYGRGKPVLVAHGGPGGYDQGALLDDLIDNGYSVIAPSRPGYLKTQLVHHTFDKQADLFAALLDSLDIDKVVILGISAGGPTAEYFAIRHPDKTAGLILEAAVSTAFMPPDQADDSFWGRMFLSKRCQDVLSFFLILLTRLMPITTIKWIMQIETTYTKEERANFVKFLKKKPDHIRWFKRLMYSTVPLSVRRKGLDNDIKELKELPKIPLGEILAPTLIIHSKYDNDVKWEHAENLIQNIPNNEFVEVHGGHLMWIGKDKAKITEKRIEFLRKYLV